AAPVPSLLADGGCRRVLVLEFHPAGVDQLELATVPVAIELLAIARDARPRVHDGLPGTAEAVDQRRLADVRIPDYSDLHWLSMTGRTGPPRSAWAAGCPREHRVAREPRDALDHSV